MSKEFDWQVLASKLFCLLVFVAAAVVLPTAAVRIFMPFLLSIALCAAIIPAARGLSRVIPFGERAWRIILLIFSFFGISVLLFELSRRLYAEISELLGRFGAGELRIVMPYILDGRLGELVSEMSVNLLTSLGSALGSLLKTVVSAAPSAILFGVSFVMFSIYFCLDYEKILANSSTLLPENARKRFASIRERVLKALGGFLRAYAVLFALTFVLSLVGLLILGRKYALTIALVIALVDMLPVLGVGAVLVPWALCSVLTGNIGLGIGLALLWLIITAIRAAAEPRIIGESIGISPILSLVAAYAGFKLFGVLGMLLTPVAAAVIGGLTYGEKSDIMKS